MESTPSSSNGSPIAVEQRGYRLRKRPASPRRGPASTIGGRVSSSNRPQQTNMDGSTKKRKVSDEEENLIREKQKFEALMQMTEAVSSQQRPRDIISTSMPLFKELLGADRCSVFRVDKANNRLRTTLAEGTTEISIPLTAGIVGHVVRTGEQLNIRDAYIDERFDPSVDVRTGYRTTSILCSPIKHPSAGVIGAVQMLNKKGGAGYFTAEDAMLCSAFSVQLGVGLFNAELFDSLNNSHKKTEALLQIMEVSNRTDNVAVLLEQIVASIRKVFLAEKVRVYLVDMNRKEFYCKVTETGSTLLHVPMDESRIEGYVALRDEKAVMNIPDLSASDLPFASDTHGTESGAIHSVLCGASRDRSGRPLAVVKVINKKPDELYHHLNEITSHMASPSKAESKLEAEPFTEADNQLLISMLGEVSNILMQRSYEASFNSALADTKSDAETILWMYTHDTQPVNRTSGKSVVKADTRKRKNVCVPSLKRQLSDATKHLSGPDFDAWSCSPDELLSVVSAIFQSLQLVQRFSLPGDKLRSFLDAVCLGYRDNHYHNFRHGVTVLHSTFMIITNGGGIDYVSHLEVLALTIASLCHDINHSGVNNAFLVNSSDDLAISYNDNSVLENMHASFTFQLLRQSEHNILCNLSRDEYKQVRKVMISAILATDMANHFDLTSKLCAMASDNSFDGNDQKGKTIVMNAAVHSADICSVLLKPDISQRWAAAIAKEFNEQVVREEEDNLPISSFMRTNDDESLAKMNLDFIDYIVTPLWTALSYVSLLLLVPCLFLFLALCICVYFFYLCCVFIFSELDEFIVTAVCCCCIPKSFAVLFFLFY